MTEPTVLLALEVVTKGAIVLSSGFLAVTLARRSSPAWRHFILAVSLLGAVAVLPMVKLLPSWHVPFITRDVASAPVILREPAAPPPVRTRATPSASEPLDRVPAVQRIPAPEPSVALPQIDLESLGVLWLLGVLAILAYHGVGVFQILQLRRTTPQLTERSLLQLSAQLRESLGITRNVELYVSADATMPVTWGTFRPAILLPAEWQTWSATRQRAVLHHELAHVARFDCAWQVVATLACALHWMNPIVWMATRRLRAERERACDDLVVASGTDACDYAEHLVAIARTHRTSRVVAMAAIAMARPSQLEGRLLWILDDGANRTAPRRSTKAIAAGLMALLLLPTAAMRPWRDEPAQPRATTAQTNAQLSAPRLAPLPAITDTLTWTRHMNRGQWIKVYTMKSDVVVEPSTDGDVHVITIFGFNDGRGPRAHEFDEDERQIEVCPALPLGVKRIPRSGCWPVEWAKEVAADNAVRTVVRVPDGLFVDVKTSTGNIIADNAQVPIMAGSEHGGVRISTNSHATANTVDGDVDVSFTRTAWRGTIDLKTVSGKLNVHLPRDASTDVEVMTSTGDARTSFPLSQTWRGPRWRYHGSAQLGGGGRKISVETWTGVIDVRRDGDSESHALERTFIEKDPTPESNPNPNPNPGEATANPSPNAGSNARGQDAEFEYDALPREDNGLIDRPYRATEGGATGERVAFDLRGGFLRSFSRDKLRGASDSAAVASLADLATRRWLAYQSGKIDPGVELVGERALWALSRRGSGDLSSAMRRELTSADWRTRAYAAWALGEIRATTADGALISALSDPHWRVRMAAAYAIGETRSASARGALERLLADSQYQVRAGALDALAAIGDARSLSAVRPLVNDPHEMVRAEAEAAVLALSKR